MPLPSPNPKDATLLLTAAADGDNDAAKRLFPLVYEQLRMAAQHQMAAERSDHTLSATALVHEAYLKLIGPREVEWAGRGHFYAAAADAMRRIRLDHATGRAGIKRGGAGGREGAAADFEDFAALACRDSEEIVRFDEVFRCLEAESPDEAAVARLRFFGGLSVKQTAAALEMSTRTVERCWAFARARQTLLRTLRNSFFPGPTPLIAVIGSSFRCGATRRVACRCAARADSPPHVASPSAGPGS